MRRTPHKNQAVRGCGFHHVAIRTADWERSLRFWMAGLGFHVAVEWGEAPRRACMLDTGDGNYLEIFERDPLPDGPSETAAILHFCFRTDDVDSAVERARAAGAEITIEPKDIAVFGEPKIPVRLAFFKGPDGEVCELMQQDFL